MAFKVRIFSEDVDYEALHAAKLTEYPLETRDYKPYAQARICFDRTGLCVQLLAFEAKPLPDSQLCVVLAFPKGPQMEFSMFADERPVQLLEGVQLRQFSGEDLQGLYWGGNLSIPAALYAPFSAASGLKFSGNFYKICENPDRPHYGSYFPADFSLKLSAQENLSEFLCISY